MDLVWCDQHRLLWSDGTFPGVQYLGYLPAGRIHGATADAVLLQRPERQQEAYAQVVFLYFLPAAPAGAGFAADVLVI